MKNGLVLALLVRKPGTDNSVNGAALVRCQERGFYDSVHHFSAGFLCRLRAANDFRHLKHLATSILFPEKKNLISKYKMNQEIVDSVQQAITPAECADLYYPGEENTQIQCYASTVENRYIVSLPSVALGASSTVTFNPADGLGDIVLTMRLPAPTGSLYTNWRLSRGWGSQLIRQIG